MQVSPNIMDQTYKITRSIPIVDKKIKESSVLFVASISLAKQFDRVVNKHYFAILRDLFNCDVTSNTIKLTSINNNSVHLYA